jgi:Ca-activated chloride channel homolog
MIHFANTEYFNYAWWIPVALVMLWLYWKWREARIKQLADNNLLDSIFPGHKSNALVISGGLLLLVSATLILALANPLGKAHEEKGKKTGIDIVIALDVSKSMDAQDVKPSRLSRANRFVSNLAENFAGNRIGLVVFAGSAYVQMPLTTDANALKMFLGSTSTDMAPEQGTSIGEAIETSAELLFPNGHPASTNVSKVILLVTDGENHDDNAVKAAREAGKNGVVIYSIGVGTEAGAPIPQMVNGVLQGYIRDDNGETVVSKLDPGALGEIATAAHGSFFRLSGGDDDLQKVITGKLNALSKGEQDFERYDARETRFQWFAGIALFLLVIESFLRNRLLVKNRNE